MKYIKTYESLESVEKEQFARLAVLKFSRKINELFQEIYGYKLKFVEEEKSSYLSTANFVLKRLGTPIINISITLNKKVEISTLFNFGGMMAGEFRNFLISLADSKILYKRTLFSIDELNKLSDEIKDEWYLYLNMKKYNV